LNAETAEIAESGSIGASTTELHEHEGKAWIFRDFVLSWPTLAGLWWSAGSALIVVTDGL
jgi:hypothetical protein